jgi:hypothetical protein
MTVVTVPVAAVLNDDRATVAFARRKGNIDPACPEAGGKLS